jgi:hypothetical protein
MPRFCISIPANGEVTVWVDAKTAKQAVAKLKADYDVPSSDPDVSYPDDGAIINTEWADENEWSVEEMGS